MARASLIQTNFTGGELSPSLALGRVDIAKYNNGVRRLENCVLTVQGGARRRPGTRFVAATKLQDKKARLVDFVFNRNQAYVLELGEGYVRFYRDRAQLLNAGAPVEVLSPYTADQLPAVNFVQKSDTAFFVHEAVAPYRLQRYSNVQWGFGVVPFITQAFEEQGHFPAASLTLSSIAVGAATATAASAVFLKSDIGRTILYGGGTALVTGYTSSTVVAVTIQTPFEAAVIASGLWRLDGTPQASITPSSAGTVGQVISLSANFSYREAAKTITSTDGDVSFFTVSVASHGYVAGNTVVLAGTTLFDGNWVIDSVPTAGTFRVLSSGFAGKGSSTGTSARLLQSTESEVWRTEDVGKYVEINSGLVRITAVQNSGTANGEVLRALSADIPASKNSWVLSSNAWNSINGYPRAVTINTQRLLFAGSPGYPQQLWGSKIQEYLNFSFGTDDDQAFRFELDGPRNSPIRHLSPARQLLVLTESDEMSLKGGQEKPITPTNIQKTDESTTGASLVRPVKIGNETLFVQAAGKKISAIGYRYEVDGYASPDRTVFASHITGPGVIQLAHQKEPDSIIYAVRTDGVMAVCAYDIDQEVTGWGRWITNGTFESAAVIPTATGEDVYAVVQRAGGRYVEVFDPEMMVDCGIKATSVTEQATWGGLAHLDGQVVQARADGAYLGEYTVAAGSVTLTRPAKEVQIGLGFTAAVEMLQIEVGANGTTAQGNQVHVNEVIIRVLDTQAAVINGTDIEFRKFGPDLLDLPPPTYSGDVRSTTLSDEIYKTSQVITQPYPAPFHLLDVIRRVTLNDG